MEAVDEVGKGLPVEGRKWLKFGVVVGFFLGDGWIFVVVLLFFYVVLFDERAVKIGRGDGCGSADVVVLVRSVFYYFFIILFSLLFYVFLLVSRSFCHLCRGVVKNGACFFLAAFM